MNKFAPDTELAATGETSEAARFEMKQEDCVEYLKQAPNNYFDLILTSPPYFIGKEFDTSREIAEFERLHLKIMNDLWRTLKPHGNICWQVGSHIKNGEIVPLDALLYPLFVNSGFKLRNRIIWTFQHGAHNKKRFSGRHETILWFSKNDDYHFDLDAVRVPQLYPGKRHYKGPNRGELSGNPLGKNPSDVWAIPNVKAKHVEKTAHPCQFPIALAQRLIRALSPSNGMVFDPFAGVASSGAAALIEGRKFIGCETSNKYCKLAIERLKLAETGELPYRSIDKPVMTPDKGHKVAQKPEHFK